MSKHNNANWDHHTGAGREHPVDDVHHDEERRKLSGAKAHSDGAAHTGPHIPNQERASRPGAAAEERPGERTRDDSRDTQDINGTGEVGPALTDDEGYTG
jgi:hypothetical protein